MQPLVSVVVPAFNIGQYLPGCIDSLRRQTYKNIEVILVDDGSSDSTGAVCDGAAASDSRFKVIHKANGGPSEARNRALDVMTGEFVTFVDGDDLVAEKYVERLLAALQNEGADISICDLTGFSRNEKGEDILPDQKEDNGYSVLSADEALSGMLRQDGFDTEAWGKMYKASLFKDIRFPVGMLNEDLAVIYKCFLKAEKVVFCKEILHYYRQRPDSIMGTKTDLKRYRDSYEIIGSLVSDIYAERPELAKAADSRAISVYSQSYAGAVLCGDEELASECWNKITEFRTGVLMDRKARPKARAAALLSCFGKRAFLKAYNRFVR